jgi:membrane fusion protein, heavy metal efflux system
MLTHPTTAIAWMVLTAALSGTSAGSAVPHDAAAQADATAAPRWMRAPSPTCSTSSTTITLASASAARAAGLELAQVKAEPLARTLQRNAEVAYNATRHARLSSRAAGVVAEVRTERGTGGADGDGLAVVDCLDLGTAKADLVQAIELLALREATAARERALVQQGIGNARQVLEAETRAAEARIEAAKARQRLKTYGLTPQRIAAVEAEGDTDSLLPILAPFAGMVVERTAVIGEQVDAARPLLTIADTRVMWAFIDLRESDLALVRSGQQVTLDLDGMPGERFAGTITWISPQMDHVTRTIKARAELANPDGMLRANMFARATIEAGAARPAVTIPKEAVQWEGCCNVAFVRDDAQGLTYRPVRLTLGYDAGDRYEVHSGLQGGEMIVTRGSFILKNEILKSAVGAGCCEVGHLDK